MRGGDIKFQVDVVGGHRNTKLAKSSGMRSEWYALAITKVEKRIDGKKIVVKPFFFVFFKYSGKKLVRRKKNLDSD